MKKVAILLSLIVSVSATQLKVPSAYSTIQVAIDAASAGDTVLVAAGTYTENINFNGKNIVVLGEDKETTIIDGNANGKSVVTFQSGEDSTAVLKNFTITNSGGFKEGDFGGGIYVKSSKATLESLIIDNNDVSGATYTGGAGGVCVISDGKVYINNSVIRNTIGAAALYANKNSDIIASNCLIADNKAHAISMGTFYIGNGLNDVTLKNCTITNNLGPAIEGAGISWGTVIATNSIIYNNLDSDGNNASYSCNEDCLDYNKFTYSLVQGGHSGTGNIDTDPKFMKIITTGDEESDYHLIDWSPAIGAGTASGAPTTDIEGNPRPNPAGSNPDMGAYENQYGTPQNAPTVIATQSDLTIAEDGISTATLTATDEDDDAITYSAVSDTNAVTVSVSSATLTLTPNANWHGVANIKAYASCNPHK
jgi:hypothetical protein